MNRTFKLFSALCLAGIVSTGAFADAGHDGKGTLEPSPAGSPADPSAATRTVRVEMLDTMRLKFDPPLNLRRGDVVKFELVNLGQIRHEFAIGSAGEQDDHRKLMMKNPTLVHDDASTTSVEAGESKTMVWKFDGDADEIVFSCNIPGHWQAGMVEKFSVSD